MAARFIVGGHIDLSWLIFDKTSESYEALRASFRRRVALKTFGPFEHGKCEPLSLVEGLISGIGAIVPSSHHFLVFAHQL